MRPEHWLFDGLVASRAVTEVLQLLTGCRGTGLFKADLELPGTGVFPRCNKFYGVAATLTECAMH